MSVQLCNQLGIAALVAARASFAQRTLYASDAPAVRVWAETLVDANIVAFDGRYPTDKTGGFIRDTMIPTFDQVTGYVFQSQHGALKDRALMASVYRLAQHYLYQLAENHCVGVAVCELAAERVRSIKDSAGAALASMDSDDWGVPGDHWDCSSQRGLLYALHCAQREGPVRLRALTLKYSERAGRLVYAGWWCVNEIHNGEITREGRAHLKHYGIQV